MSTKNISNITPGELIPHFVFLAMLRAAISVGEHRFARQAAVQWLSIYPGDLEVRLLHASALITGKNSEGALPILEELCHIDPEFLDAQEMLLACRHHLKLGSQSESAAIALALGAGIKRTISLPAWGTQLIAALDAMSQGKPEEVEVRLLNILANEPPTPLVALTHLELILNQNQLPASGVRSLAEHYLQKWPKCVYFKLVLANALMDGGESDKAVSLLHQAAAEDVAGLIPNRLWGPDHPYRSLWSEELEAVIDIAVPAPVAVVLGWNQLPEGDPQPISPQPSGVEVPGRSLDTEEGVPISKTSYIGETSQTGESTDEESAAETLRTVQSELERVAVRMKKPFLTQLDGRYPVYVLFSTKGGLERQYGVEGALNVQKAIESAAQHIDKDHRWRAMVLYGDNPRSTTHYGIKPGSSDDPWALKLVLTDLDAALKRRGEMIGALLIIGGPTVVPFHHLPNPVDDDDADVPSDNPYSTRDDNYFIPEWPVGRIPGAADSDPALLIAALQYLENRYRDQNNKLPWYKRWFGRFFNWIWPKEKRLHRSFGYTAAVWRKASLSVFRPIGEARTLLASPPTEAEHLTWNGLTPARLGYYNLHGLSDTAEWYGQRDPSDPVEGLDYPVAMRPEDVVNGGRAPDLVFTEACYGAHIIGKSVDQAMALKFLSAGTQAVIGSTCTSYGSIAPPLIAADMLGQTFWKNLRDGFTAGEALRRAKVFLAQEMNRRQGYLDGEDQKTLVSFILFGDPMATSSQSKRYRKTVVRQKSPPEPVKVICDRRQDPQWEEHIPDEVLTHVKRVVEQYLPGMADANYCYTHEHAQCNGKSHQCPTSEIGIKSPYNGSADRSVITLSKKVTQNTHTHAHYARLTIDERGKVVKLAISR